MAAKPEFRTAVFGRHLDEADVDDERERAVGMVDVGI